ncbi:MAG: response regulator [Sphingobacterium sp.]
MQHHTLIVDDNRLNHFILDFLLRNSKSEIQPISFYNGFEVIEKLKQSDDPQEKFLIFLDINMPVIDGWQVLEFIEESDLLENISVIILTSEVTPQIKDRAFSYNSVINFVEKPINKDKIKELIDCEH